MLDDKEWTDASITTLKELWADLSLSTAEIGRRMNRSKNSVVGKAGRLNLPSRPSPIKRPALGEARPQPKGRPTPPSLASLVPLAAAEPPAAAAPPQAAAAPAPPPAPPPPPLPRPPADSRLACCWPLGTPGTKSFAYCGEHVARGRPYCAEHQAIATVAPRDLVRETVPLAIIEAYASEHRVVVKVATGLPGLIVAVNNHRRAAGLTPFALKAKAAA